MLVLGIPTIPRRDKRQTSFLVYFTASFKLFFALKFKKLTSPDTNCFEIGLCGALKTHTSVRRELRDSLLVNKHRLICWSGRLPGAAQAASLVDLLEAGELRLIYHPLPPPRPSLLSPD